MLQLNTETTLSLDPQATANACTFPLFPNPAHVVMGIAQRAQQWPGTAANDAEHGPRKRNQKPTTNCLYQTALGRHRDLYYVYTVYIPINRRSTYRQVLLPHEHALHIAQELYPADVTHLSPTTTK